jgi:hypothetical protein
MSRWFRRYYEANAQTKVFIWNWVVYGLALIITTVYCYGRLDFVRSYKAPSTINSEQKVGT